MDEYDDRRSLIKSGSYSGYGSTKPVNSKFHRIPTKFYQTYTVMDGDTLQGIALKHSTTTAELRRLNHLFTSDSIYLGQKLLLLPDSSAPGMSQSVTVDFNDLSNPLNGASAAVDNSYQSSQTPVAAEGEISVSDFLGRFDRDLASVRKDVTKFEQNSRFVNDEELEHDPLFIRSQLQHASRQSHHHHPSHHGDGAAVRGRGYSPTSSWLPTRRKGRDHEVIGLRPSQSSMERLQRVADETFQL